MLSEYVKKVKEWKKANKKDIYIATLIFFVGMASFGLGRLSILWTAKTPIKIEYVSGFQNNGINAGGGGNIEKSLETASLVSTTEEKYVASKNGKAYHFPWCPSALKIKEENKIWFNTKEGAEKAGYKPAGNCEGL